MARVTKSAMAAGVPTVDWPVGEEGFGDYNTYKGSQLAGAIARHPMHHLGGFFAKPRPFLPGDFVTTDAGTGLVHMAPDHGEDDFLLCKQYGIDPVFAVDGAGMYRADWPWLGGQGSVINKKFVASDGPICSDLRDAGALVAASDDFAHSYPHSWRSKAKVIFRATPQWFIPMDRAEEGFSTSLETNGEESDSVASNQPFASSGVEKPVSNGATLREIALGFRSRGRSGCRRGRSGGSPRWCRDGPIGSSRGQRAWGVPIALYVNRASGAYLNDAAVNQRIIGAFKLAGRMRGLPRIMPSCSGRTTISPTGCRSRTSSTCGSIRDRRTSS